MDALVASLSAADVGEGAQGADALSSHRPLRKDLFKSRPSCIRDQQQRRRDHLERMRKARADQNDILRNVMRSSAEAQANPDGVRDEEGEVEDDGDGAEDDAGMSGEEAQLAEGSMAVSAAGKKKKKRKRKQRDKQHSIRRHLMLSEWLVHVPEDLFGEWHFVVVPHGKRCLVISSQGSTKMFLRGGKLVDTFPSTLPGGNRYQQLRGSEYAILDCVYESISRTYYVLDIMCWRGLPVYDSEFEFRSFWLHSKLSEEPESGTERTKLNPFLFKMMPRAECSRDNLRTALETAYEFFVSGLTFFHKAGPYLVGELTPLALWCTPDMIPELLGVEVPDPLPSPIVPKSTFVIAPSPFGEQAAHVTPAESAAQRTALAAQQLAPPGPSPFAQPEPHCEAAAAAGGCAMPQ